MTMMVIVMTIGMCLELYGVLNLFVQLLSFRLENIQLRFKPVTSLTDEMPFHSKYSFMVEKPTEQNAFIHLSL